MSNFGFVQIPRSLFNDPIWKELSVDCRNLFITIIFNVAWKETLLDDFGVLTTIKPGQFLTTERALVDLCFPPSKDSKVSSKNKTIIHRGLEKLRKVGFLNHEVNHKKTIITITRGDILSLIEPTIEPKVNQTRTKPEPQKKKYNKSIPKENSPLSPQRDEPLTRGGDFFIYECLKQIDNSILSEYQKKKLTKDFPNSEKKLEDALKYASTRKNIDSLYGVIKWYCEEQKPPQIPISKEDMIDQNKKFAFGIADLKNGIAKYEKSHRYCEIVPFANCEPLIFNYDQNPNEFVRSLRDSLRSYGLT